MAILKNEPCFPFKEGNYAKPRHILVSGSDEEIGYDLARLAKEEYGCILHEYADPVYGEARREYFKRNWRSMHERTKGDLRAYGFLDDKKADCIVDERTIINTTCNLFKPEISVRFYLGDGGPIPGTNHLETRMSEPVIFGF